MSILWYLSQSITLATTDGNITVVGLETPSMVNGGVENVTGHVWYYNMMIVPLSDECQSK